jgi:hypothetical protein
MILIILFNLLFIKCSTMDNSLPNSDILLFENYAQNKIILPEEPLLNEGISFSDSILVNKEWLLRPKQGHKIKGELFNVLCQFNLINQWNTYKKSEINPYSDNYEEFLEKRKQELRLFYLGEIKLNKNYKSFLILVSDGENDDYNVVRNLFLMNVMNNKVSSLTRVSSYTCFDGECNYIYTEISTNNFLIMREEEVSSDVIVPEEVQIEKGTSVIKFLYDKNGILKKTF